MLTKGRFDALRDTNIDQVCAKAGHPQLIENLPSSIRIEYNGADPVGFALDYLKFASEQAGGEHIIEVPDPLIQPLLEAHDTDGLERIAAGIAG